MNSATDKNVRGRPSFHRSKGFTLVELIVAITFLAVLTGVVTVNLEDINENTQLSNAATRALADVRYAQEMAMTHKRRVDVIVNAGTDQYEIKWHDTGLYIPSAIDGNDLIVQFGEGDYNEVDIVSSGLGGVLSFNGEGRPAIDGNDFDSDEKSVMYLNSRIYLVAFESGYLALREDIGGDGGCFSGC